VVTSPFQPTIAPSVPLYAVLAFANARWPTAVPLRRPSCPIRTSVAAPHVYPARVPLVEVADTLAESMVKVISV
jgi:hypothetical protein